jgi:hypothetical protein
MPRGGRPLTLPFPPRGRGWRKSGYNRHRRIAMAATTGVSESLVETFAAVLAAEPRGR